MSNKPKRRGGGAYIYGEGYVPILTYGPKAEADEIKKAAKIDCRSLRAFVWHHVLKAARKVDQK